MNQRYVWILCTALCGVAAAGPIEFERHAVDFGEGIWSIEAIDTTGDGNLEWSVIGADRVWAMSPQARQPWLLAHTPGGRSIHAVKLDCDGDGDFDLALGRPTSFWIQHRVRLQEGEKSKRPEGADWTVAWIENPSKPNAPWPLHILDGELHGVHGVWTGDVNGDGAPDLIANAFAGPHLESSLAWFPAPKSGAAEKGMPRRMITTGKATGRPHYMDFADVDGDGQGDVLLGASAEGSFTWWKRPEDLDREWARHEIAREPGATHPRAVDLNGDGKFDVLASAGHGVGVMWFEAPDWKKHLIDGDVRDVHAFGAADLDGDGDVDAVGCSFSQKIVRWWENLGDGTFRGHDMDTGHGQESYDVKVVDLDADGKLDVLISGRRSNNTVWYRRVK